MCTTIAIGQGENRVLAANYDYVLGHGLIGTSPRGLRKHNGRSGDARLEWSNQFSSVTLCSFSLEFPAAGMNEAGLCIALMYHDRGDYGFGAPPQRRIDSLQWIQYQLDNYSTVEEVRAGLEHLRPEGFPLHYMLLDSRGDCLVIEYIEGEPIVLLNPEPPVATNSSYTECLRSAAEVDAHAIAARTSHGRFASLARTWEDLSKSHSETVAFDALSRVAQGVVDGPWNSDSRLTTTVWSVVFSPTRRRLTFTSDQNPAKRIISMQQVELDETASPLCMEIHDGDAGEVSDLLQTYRADMNRAIVRASSQAIEMADVQVEGLVSAVDEIYASRGG
ncbi:MAG: linear amide C-N hydrolase [Myxococcota bacterium]